MKGLFRRIKKWVAVLLKPMIERIKSGPVRRRSRYARYYETLRIDENTVLYEAFAGRGMLCNPYAIFKYLMTEAAFSGLKHVWVLDNPEQHRLLIEEYRSYPNVTFVKYESRTYLKYLCKAKYLVNNSTFPPYFTKKTGQIYINTWHGIPLKTLGFDMPDGNLTCANTIRNFLQTDFLLAANSFLSKIFLESYKLQGLFEGKIIEAGYPRTDLLVLADRQEMIQKLKLYGVGAKAEQKIILYAPTWKGKTFGKPDDSIHTYLAFKEYVESRIDTSEYQILVKPHQSVYQANKQQIDQYDCFVPAMIDATELLAITDILITDYSSIYFDYLPTNRPVFFYIPDLEAYSDYRGLYFPIEDLPGPATANLDTLCVWLKSTQNVMEEKKEKFVEIRDWSIVLEPGKITEKVIQIVFKGEKEPVFIKSADSKRKKKILFHRGSMRVNGISTSFLSLLKNIDYDKYDVSAVVSPTRKEEEQSLIFSIDPRVRVLTRSSTLNVTLFEDIHQKIISNYGLNQKRRDSRLFEKAFGREYKRCFGDSKFDYIMDFDGYRIFYNLIYFQQKTASVGIWQHSDMFAEQVKKFDWLKNLFTLYPFFDTIISCSQAIMEVNRKNLSTDETFKKFTYAKNTFDFHRVVQGAMEDSFVVYGEKAYCYIAGTRTEAISSAKLVPLELSDRTLNKCKSPNGILEIQYTERDWRPEKTLRFATMGRLSVEKNHECLIKAFYKFQLDYPNSILYIIGEGLLRKKLEDQISKLKLQTKVILTGNLKNPFALLKHCDCFVLPSLHEGQPMVIQEVRVLKLPIIVSNFSSVNGSLIENGQLMIEPTEDGIYSGLKAYVAGEVPTEYTFDAERYNREAYGEFLAAIGEPQDK